MSAVVIVSRARECGVLPSCRYDLGGETEAHVFAVGKDADSL